MPTVKMCNVSKGKEMSHRKYYKKGLNLSAAQTLLRPHALYSGNAVKPTSSHSRRTKDRPLPVASRLGGGGLGGPGSARRSAASGVSVRQPQPASFDAGSRGRRPCLLKGDGSLRLSHPPKFCLRNALNQKAKDLHETRGKFWIMCIQKHTACVYF